MGQQQTGFCFPSRASLSLQGNLHMFYNTGFNNSVTFNEAIQLSDRDWGGEGKINERKDATWQAFHLFWWCHARVCSFSPHMFSHANSGKAPVLGTTGDTKFAPPRSSQSTVTQTAESAKIAQQVQTANATGVQKRDCTCCAGVARESFSDRW